ncbi:hypothetical protein H4Q26_001759 [Puccinia striiformis f. sp. tritici PST-130]|nr:hypothetical protein H4Q26_001759 [Puccinia striiformis f. sp. tritici PST-130]
MAPLSIHFHLPSHNSLIPRMVCIICLNEPPVFQKMCQTCLDAAAAHVNCSEVPAPTTLHNKSAAVKSKQNQACMRAKEMLAKTKATVNPPTTSTSKQPRSPELQVTSSSPAPPDDLYDKAQQKRMSVCAKRSSPKTNKQQSSKSKPSSSKKVPEKNPQPTTGVIPASPSLTILQRFCVVLRSGLMVDLGLGFLFHDKESFLTPRIQTHTAHYLFSFAKCLLDKRYHWAMLKSQIQLISLSLY